MNDTTKCYRPQGACKHCRRFTVNGPKCPLYGNPREQEYIPGKGDIHDPFPKCDPEDDTFEI